MEIVPFNFESHEVRTVVIDGEPWFVAGDVARILGYRMASDMTRRLDDEDKGTRPMRTPSGDQEMTIISEAGLYESVLGSKVEGARAFKRWITREVIPTIRKTGSYGALEIPRTLPEALRAYANEVESHEFTRAELKAVEPKRIFADAVAASSGTILVGELAKILRGNGVEVGQNRLFGWLRANGYLIRREGTDRNMPTQRSMELGLFEIKETAVTHSDGHVTISKTPRVTGKGQQYFINLFLEAKAAR